MMVAAITVTGCARRSHITDESAISGTSGTGEESVNESGSLGRYKRSLGPEEDGVLKDVHFAYDSYELDGSARDVLAANAEWLKENEARPHRDRGSLRRARHRRIQPGARREAGEGRQDYLVTLGVASDRLTTISYGEELPLLPRRERTMLRAQSARALCSAL